MANALKEFKSVDEFNDPVYIGIDQSYSGFAITILNDEGYKTTVYKSELRGVDRLNDIHRHMVSTLQFLRIADVAMEGYAFGREFGVAMSGELGGMVKWTLHYIGPYYPLIVQPTVVKKYVTGIGQGVKKNQILLNVYKKWDVEFTDDNAADSYALAHIVSGKASLAYEKEIYKKLQDPKYREK